MTKMNAKCLSFAVVMLHVVQCVMTEAELSPVKWSPSLLEQCGEHGNVPGSQWGAGVASTPVLYACAPPLPS